LASGTAALAYLLRCRSIDRCATAQDLHAARDVALADKRDPVATGDSSHGACCPLRPK